MVFLIPIAFYAPTFTSNRPGQYIPRSWRLPNTATRNVANTRRSSNHRLKFVSLCLASWRSLYYSSLAIFHIVAMSICTKIFQITWIFCSTEYSQTTVSENVWYKKNLCPINPTPYPCLKSDLGILYSDKFSQVFNFANFMHIFNHSRKHFFMLWLQEGWWTTSWG